jgi:hypothetical protein
MKKLLFLTTFVLGVSCSAWATTACPTTPTSLSTYDTSGYTCTVDDLMFSGFQYVFGGGTSVPDADISVTPVMGTETGLTFDYIWAAGTGESLDSDIIYTVTCDGCLISDVELTSSGGFTGNGIASATETGTGGIFLENTYTSGTNVSFDSATISPAASSLTLHKDIGASGIFGGTASISGVANLFSTTGNTSPVPEPPLLLLSVALLGLVPFARRKFSR